MKGTLMVPVDSEINALPVMEAFYTLQGEGFHTGKPAYFIRLGGCDVGCHWCDVKESWDASQHPQIKTRDLASQARQHYPAMVVVTGGEPLMYNLDKLCSDLNNEGLRTHLETSGAYPISGNWDWICFSPKKFKSPLTEVYKKADELKIVIYNSSDFEWAEQHARLVTSDCKLYLQPEWGRAKKMMPMMVDYIKSNPRWQMSLQTHKYLNIP